MFIADVTVRFENGSEGAKVFEASTRDDVHYQVDTFLRNVVQYAKAKQKNLVKSHSVRVKEVI